MRLPKKDQELLAEMYDEMSVSKSNPTSYGSPYSGSEEDIVYIDDLMSNITKLETSIKSGDQWLSAHVASNPNESRAPFMLFSKPNENTTPALVRANPGYKTNVDSRPKEEIDFKSIGTNS